MVLDANTVGAYAQAIVLIITALTSLVAAFAALKAKAKAEETVLISKEVGERVDGKLKEFMELQQRSSHAEGVLEGKEVAEGVAKIASDLVLAAASAPIPLGPRTEPIPVKIEDSVPVHVEVKEPGIYRPEKS